MSPLLLLLVTAVHYPANAQFKIPYDVVAGGGAQMHSANYGSRGTSGQMVIGTGNSDSFGSNAGFWYSPGTTVTGTGDTKGDVPTTFSLQQNHPNPFNPSTTIRFSLPRHSHVKLRVYDVSGRLVTTLVDRGMMAGVHSVVWNASGLATGVYLYRIQAGGFVQTRKLVLLK
jgi:hypothetical protein